MFGRRFAFQFQRGREEGWNPPWLQEEGPERGPRGFGPGMRRGWGPFGFRFGGLGHFAMRHGPFGPGGPFGGMHRGPFGPGAGGEGRFFGRGDLKFALLGLLQERPMHGYEMIKALEEKSGGFYAPSPGSIYPTLQMLEDRGFVTLNEVEGKKVYSITDAGRASLAERQGQAEEFAGPPWAGRHGFGFGFGRQRQQAQPEMQALKSEAQEVMRLLIIAGRKSFEDPAQLARLRTVMERTRKELADMIYGTAEQPGPSASSPSSGE